MIAIYNSAKVEVVSVSGGWSTVKLADGKTKKVRNGALFPVQEVTPAEFVPPAKPKVADKPKKEAKPVATAKPEKAKPKSKKFNGENCPQCNSTEISKNGEKVSCHDCGWSSEKDSSRIRHVGNSSYRVDDYVQCKSADGSLSYDCGDRVAKALRGMPLSDVYNEASKVLQIPVKELQKVYEHLNSGMQRMNLGNRIRKALK